MKERKYITTQLEAYRICGVEISRRGFVTADENLASALESSPAYNRWFFRVSTDGEVAGAALDWAKKVVGENMPQPIEVEPVSPGNIDDELEALADEARIREEQHEAEQAVKEANAAKRLSFNERLRPNTAAEQKAKAAAKKGTKNG